MGLEATCDVRASGRVSRGKARLESDALFFRGDFDLRIPLKDVRSATARRGVLEVTLDDGGVTLDLGPEAEKWALKIRYPRSRIDKLGVKPGAGVSVLGIEDAGFLEELRSRTKDVTQGRARSGSDLVFVGMDSTRDLPKIERLRQAIQEHGAIWVVWPKGRKAFREDDVRGFSSTAGLVDVKVVSFSDTLSALKLVIPLGQRLRARRRKRPG